MQTPYPLTRDVLLIGGGHTHALLLKMWGMDPLPGARLTLVNPGPVAAYSGMLPGLAAGHYRLEELELDLVRLARFAGARILFDRVTGLDPETGSAMLANRPPVAFDIASINTGITSPLPGLPGEAEMVRAKPLHVFAGAWQAYVAAAEAGGPATAGILGGGVAGAELAMAMAYRLKKARGDDARVHLFEREADILGEEPALRDKVRAGLKRLGVEVRTGFDARSYSEGMLKDIEGKAARAEFLGLATGAQPDPWFAGTGLDLTGGYITVDATLRSVSHPHIFAAGDAAHLSASPRPKAGVYAVREAPVLYANLRAALSGRKLKPYKPQKDYLKLVSLGGKQAAGEKFGRVVAGAAMWRLKTRIDRAFMRKLTDLAPMTLKPPAEAATGVADILKDGPPCGGCGAKVGHSALTHALSALPPATRPDILSGPGDDAAMLDIGGARQVITTDQLRAFIEDPRLFARIAATHALGDIWAMGAEPQAALIQIILPRMSPGLQERSMAEILDGAREVLTEAGAAIVGGHSGTGAELTIGLTITGLLPGHAITNRGAQAGDILILTKPIGTGTIMAGDMRLKARGRDVEAALSLMQQGSAGDARALAPVAKAMTDVTGFGLAGHLRNLLETGGLGATLTLDAIPFAEGAVALSEAGIRSSLYPDNLFEIDASKKRRKDPRLPLLFDPQTAGGLLAAIPPGSETLLETLSETSAIIGRIEAKPGIRVT